MGWGGGGRWEAMDAEEKKWKLRFKERELFRGHGARKWKLAQCVREREGGKGRPEAWPGA